MAGLLPADLYAETNNEGLDLVMHRAATKLAAAQLLLARWGLGPAQAAAFGDDVSDAPLLAGCGWGVAVANAGPAAKHAARFVCASNDEDGVANWLAAHLPAGEDVQ